MAGALEEGSGHPHLSHDALVEQALCFGWVDSQPRKFDAQRSQLRTSPRQSGSNLSDLNRARVERLVEAGLMQPTGLVAAERVKADGTWNALDAVEQLLEPDDLKTLLSGDKDARSQWDAFPPSTRRAILEWLGTARTEATRQRRLEHIVSDGAPGDSLQPVAPAEPPLTSVGVAQRRSTTLPAFLKRNPSRRR